MKTAMVGIVSVLIFLVMAGVGFGIAQAAVTHPEQRGLSIEDQKIIPVVYSPEEFVPESNYSGTDWQAIGPVEADVFPVMVPEEPWVKEYGQD